MSDDLGEVVAPSQNGVRRGIWRAQNGTRSSNSSLKLRNLFDAIDGVRSTRMATARLSEIAGLDCAWRVRTTRRERAIGASWKCS